MRFHKEISESRLFIKKLWDFALGAGVAIQCNTIQHNATPSNTIQHHPTQFNTMQHNRNYAALEKVFKLKLISSHKSTQESNT